MPGQDNKQAIHPFVIFKQAWGVSWSHIISLGAIYLIFNLPVTLIALTPVIRSLAEQKSNLSMGLWQIITIVFSSWGHIALLLGVNQALSTQHCDIVQNIKQATLYLGRYLFLILCIALLFVGSIMLFSVSTAIAGTFLPKISNMLTAITFLVLIVALICLFVFFGLRWSLAALVCVFERTWPVAALKSSFALIRKHINPVVGLYFLAGLTYLASLFPLFIARILTGAGKQTDVASQAGTALYLVFINVMLIPLVATIAVLLYKKLKEV